MFTNYIPSQKTILEKGFQLLLLSSLTGTIVWLGRTVSIINAARSLSFFHGALFSASTLLSFQLGHYVYKKLESIGSLDAPILKVSAQATVSLGIPICIVAWVNPLTIGQCLYLSAITMISRIVLRIDQA